MLHLIKNVPKRAVYAAILVAAIAAAALFLLQKAQTARLYDRLLKAQADVTRAEEERLQWEQKYEKLREEYEALEQTKAKERSLPVVYLTFDDGPSENTPQVLDILKECDVKATFFVVGREDVFGARMYRRLLTEGHAAGNHTYSHEYGQIYASTERFWEEISKTDELFFQATGQHLTLLRFPGGSNNTVSRKYGGDIMQTLTAQAKERGIPYFDWNVSAKDAEKAHQSTNVIISSVLKDCNGKRDAVILMHDGLANDTTAAALPVIIRELKARGYIFKKLSKNVSPVRFLQ